MSEVKKEKRAKPRATLAVAGRTGLEALMSIARDAPPAPSAADRLAKARADREAKVRAALTKDVVNVAVGLRQKGYGYALIANTITDVLNKDVKITAKVIKSVLEQAAAPQQPAAQQKAAVAKNLLFIALPQHTDASTGAFKAAGCEYDQTHDVWRFSGTQASVDTIVKQYKGQFLLEPQLPARAASVAAAAAAAKK